MHNIAEGKKRDKTNWLSPASVNCIRMKREDTYAEFDFRSGNMKSVTATVRRDVFDHYDIEAIRINGSVYTDSQIRTKKRHNILIEYIYQFCDIDEKFNEWDHYQRYESKYDNNEEHNI
jgi:hypothetical protein